MPGLHLCHSWSWIHTEVYYFQGYPRRCIAQQGTFLRECNSHNELWSHRPMLARWLLAYSVVRSLARLLSWAIAQLLSCSLAIALLLACIMTHFFLESFMNYLYIISLTKQCPRIGIWRKTAVNGRRLNSSKSAHERTMMKCFYLKCEERKRER